METGYRVSASKNEYKVQIVQTQEEAVEVATSLIAEGFTSVVISDRTKDEEVW